jgi:predicted DCC family thiol-disulfide oxidoreductase YuxK
MQNLSIILFDGVCNLCNGAVRLVIKHDRKKNFKFASLQSGAAQQLLQRHGHTETSSAQVLKKMNSVVLIENGQLFQKSIAALKVLRHFPWYWQWLQAFRIVPRFIRDAVYDVIAKNRYRWFGKKDNCMIPTPELKSRFLE